LKLLRQRKEAEAIKLYVTDPNAVSIENAIALLNGSRKDFNTYELIYNRLNEKTTQNAHMPIALFRILIQRSIDYVKIARALFYWDQIEAFQLVPDNVCYT
jgi:hypothetical protein